MIVLDASVLIAHLDADDSQHERATELLGENVADPLIASRLTLAEVLVGPARAGKLDIALRALDDLEVRGIGMDEQAPSRLASLRAESGLKMPDCCVLLAAEQVRGTVGAFDHRLRKAALKLGFAVKPDFG